MVYHCTTIYASYEGLLVYYFIDLVSFRRREHDYMSISYMQ